MVVDTCVIVAMANKRDDYHTQCVDLMTRYSGSLLLPEPLVTEVGYMLGTRAGSKAEAGFLRDVADGAYELKSFKAADFNRVADLVETYANLKLGTADACVMALAERENVHDIATVNYREFMIVRPLHVDRFNLLPDIYAS
ncbi:PIN domain-containing protein [Streptomyces sp. ID05-26A]|nr:PIN domain-containing protein [Streptomyces sp. ID05-26A]